MVGVQGRTGAAAAKSTKEWKAEEDKQMKLTIVKTKGWWELRCPNHGVIDRRLMLASIDLSIEQHAYYYPECKGIAKGEA